MKFLKLFLILLFLTSSAFAEEIITLKDISWLEPETFGKAGEYQKERGCLDIKYPQNGRDLPVLVWFHGGGLEAGRKHFPVAYESCKLFQEKKLIIITAAYRLHPQVDFPLFLEDAASVIAWVSKNIYQYGGSPQKIFVSGGSAGGYLSAMIGMDPRWLAKHNMKPTDLCGILPVSGQMTTHFNVKKWLKYPGLQYQPVIDENAPLGHLSADGLPPVFLIVGDRNIEWKARVQENELVYASLKALGHPMVEFSESPGIGHAIAGMGKNMLTIDPKLFDRIDNFILRAIEFQTKKNSAPQPENK